MNGDVSGSARRQQSASQRSYDLRTFLSQVVDRVGCKNVQKHQPKTCSCVSADLLNGTVVLGCKPWDANRCICL